MWLLLMAFIEDVEVVVPCETSAQDDKKEFCHKVHVSKT